MAAKQYFNPKTSSPFSGATHAVRVDNTIYVSGQVALAQDGSVVGKGDPEAQVRQIYRNIEGNLKAAGAGLQDIVKTTIYITKLDYFAAVRKVRSELFKSNPPASTAVVVTGLANPDFMIEIDVIAVVGK